jgi:vacuolar-type H+-ATPase subunit I/STV1
MKMAVIIGVSHMMMGIVVKGLNVVYLKQWVIFGTEVVTGVLILGGLFGWMDFLIFSKWFFKYFAYNYELGNALNDVSLASDATEALCWEFEKQYNNVANSPSVYTILINNFLSGGN